jgi:hypothetical protein
MEIHQSKDQYRTWHVARFARGALKHDPLCSTPLNTGLTRLWKK